VVTRAVLQYVDDLSAAAAAFERARTLLPAWREAQEAHETLLARIEALRQALLLPTAGEPRAADKREAQLLARLARDQQAAAAQPQLLAFHALRPAAELPTGEPARGRCVMCRALRAIATGSTYQDLLVLEWTGQKLLVSSRCLPSAVLSATALQQSCLGTSLSLSLSLSLSVP
jgi:hypothetical protein